MTDRRVLPELAARIVEVDELLASLAVRHQFGGAIALAWYRNPRATSDIDLNVTLPPEEANPVLSALRHIGVSVGSEQRHRIAEDGQARLTWGASYLDLFFATLDLHEEMAERARVVEFGPTTIPILAPEDLVICKAVFDRPKDWVDIEAMVAWGTKIERVVVLGWIEELLGAGSAAYERLAGLLVQE